MNNIKINNHTIDLDECDDVVCSTDGCENGLFISAFTLKRVSSIMIAQPKDKIVNLNQMVCTACGVPHDASKQPEKKENLIDKTLKVIAK